jgi:hypothetical protein
MIPRFQSCGTVCSHGGVNEEGKRDVLILFKGCGLRWPAVPHHNQFCS